MRIRFADVIDEQRIYDLYKKDHITHFAYPSRRNRLSTVIAEDDKLIGSLILKARPEVTLILDAERSKRIKADALNLLVQSSIMNLRHQGFEEALVFTDVPKFDEILIKHYGFKAINQKALILELG